MTRDAARLLERLDAIIARAGSVGSRLTIRGFFGAILPHPARADHDAMTGELRGLAADLRKALEPEQPADATADHPAMWATRPEGKPGHDEPTDES